MAGRVSQQPTEVLYEPTPAARVSQQPTEVLYEPTPAARVSQVAVEVVYTEGSAPPSVGRSFAVMVG